LFRHAVAAMAEHDDRVLVAYRRWALAIPRDWPETT